MMNLTARTPSFVSSSASSNPGETSYGYQDPGRSVASDDRTGKPENSSPPDYTQVDSHSKLLENELKDCSTKLMKNEMKDGTTHLFENLMQVCLGEIWWRTS